MPDGAIHHQTIIRLSSTCKAMRKAAEPLLYGTITLNSLRLSEAQLCQNVIKPGYMSHAKKIVVKLDLAGSVAASDPSTTDQLFSTVDVTAVSPFSYLCLAANKVEIVELRVKLNAPSNDAGFVAIFSSSRWQLVTEILEFAIKAPPARPSIWVTLSAIGDTSVCLPLAALDAFGSSLARLSPIRLVSNNVEFGPDQILEVEDPPVAMALSAGFKTFKNIRMSKCGGSRSFLHTGSISVTSVCSVDSEYSLCWGWPEDARFTLNLPECVYLDLGSIPSTAVLLEYLSKVTVPILRQLIFTSDQLQGLVALLDDSRFTAFLERTPALRTLRCEVSDALDGSDTEKAAMLHCRDALARRNIALALDVNVKSGSRSNSGALAFIWRYASADIIIKGVTVTLDCSGELVDRLPFLVLPNATCIYFKILNPQAAGMLPWYIASLSLPNLARFMVEVYSRSSVFKILSTIVPLLPSKCELWVYVGTAAPSLHIPGKDGLERTWAVQPRAKVEASSMFKTFQDLCQKYGTECTLGWNEQAKGTVQDNEEGMQDEEEEDAEGSDSNEEAGSG